MAKCFQFLFFLLFYSLYYFTLCSATESICPHDQSLLLLEFKQSFSISQYIHYDCDQSSYPKTESWNKSTNCCNWEGVSCDNSTGQVIELDLSCSRLSGTIDSNSSLFHLFRLQRLNLAFNDIESTQISRIFGNLTRLTNINLSSTGFTGQLPSEILKLTELTSLDLSHNYLFTVGPDIFKLLLTNFTKLSQVVLTDLNIPSSIPKNLSSSLEAIEIRDINLYGELPQSIFHLPNLKTLDLANSHLHVILPTVIWKSHKTLEWLDLSRITSSGKIPDSIEYLKALKYLNLESSGFNGSLPQNIFHLPNLKTLILGGNPQLYGTLPSVRWNSHSNLEWLDLSPIQFLGEIPDSVGYLKALKHLDLYFCGFNGSLPKRIFMDMTQIETINLAANSFVGSLPLFTAEMNNLTQLFLDNNKFTGTIMQSGLFSLTSIEWLDLSFNQLHLAIPMELSSLVNLQHLDLSSNNFTGHVDVCFFSNMKRLSLLGLSHNRLSLITKNNCTLPESSFTLKLASCKITELEFLRNVSTFFHLDLSKNNIQEIPSWLWSNWKRIIYLNISHNSIIHNGEISFEQISLLDIRSNLFQGPFPQVPANIEFLFISNNHFSGVMPPSIICRLSSIFMLDLANNKFVGSIPQCIGNTSQYLSVLDMHMNNLEGMIPITFSSKRLRTINLHGNHLRGSIPSSLINCTSLEVLDLGNNHLNDSFPSWLGVLPELRVLSLRFNNFHGEVSVHGTTSFMKLQILDLSHNHFIGSLSPNLFKIFIGMMEMTETSESPRYIGHQASTFIGSSAYYTDSTFVVNKGIEFELGKILTAWNTIDLSSNNFQGIIPSSVGSLISVRQLNFSNNRFAGEIPISLGNLSVLESLDLSSNQLIGTIPTELATLDFLSKLDLSHNHLTGRIPSSKQFQTMGNESFIDNNGLCGFPLSKNCVGDKVYPPVHSQAPEAEDDSDFMDGFSWKSVLTGYVVGMVFGLVIGCLVFLTRKPAWLSRIVEEEGYTILMKRNRKKKILRRIGRHN